MSEPTDRARAMRAAFDRSFAEPPAPAPASSDDLLAIRVGDQARAIALEDIRAVHVDRRVAAVPGPEPALLGLAAFRGVIVPVWDLRVLLGVPRGPMPRWLVLAARSAVAFAFDTFEGHVRVPHDAITSGALRVIEAGGVSRVVISLPALVDEVGRRTERIRRTES